MLTWRCDVPLYTKPGCFAASPHRLQQYESWLTRPWGLLMPCRCFELVRSTVRAVFFLPSRDSISSVAALGRRSVGSNDASAAAGDLDLNEQGGAIAQCTWARSPVQEPTDPHGLGATTSRGISKPQLTRSKSAHVSMVRFKLSGLRGTCAVVLTGAWIDLPYVYWLGFTSHLCPSCGRRRRCHTGMEMAPYLHQQV